jgi:GT2 family glycosyltransferase
MTASSIVVPVHGREELTRACLDALLAAPLPRCEVIVVDDASGDSTPELLDSYGEAIRRVALTENSGYAAACNEGAALARGSSLLFLNNDIQPHAGWLQTLLAYAERVPEAAAVGAKLLYLNGTVQHAGVAFGQDGYPHNLYAGLPAAHPAVNRSRRLQAVTGACMYVRRDAFERVGGFDRGFLNSLEDVDLCLRIGEVGGEVHYCHDAVLTHLESASRGRRDRFEQSVALYRERWRDRVRRDDLALYVEDGLLAFEYPEAFPLRLSVSPYLASVDNEREAVVERRLEAYAGQVSDLLAEVVRLTTALGAAPSAGAPPSAEDAKPLRGLDHERFLRDANRLEDEVRELQLRLEQASPAGPGESPPLASDRLGYRRLVERIRAEIEESVPEGASVLVVSRGDRALVELADRVGGHFPQSPDGGYLGHHPGDSAEAVAQLEKLRAGGAEYLVLPSTAFWWLEHYGGFAEHLRERYPVVALGACAIYGLAGDRSAELAGEAVR